MVYKIVFGIYGAGFLIGFIVPFFMGEYGKHRSVGADILDRFGAGILAGIFWPVCLIGGGLEFIGDEIWAWQERKRSKDMARRQGGDA